MTLDELNARKGELPPVSNSCYINNHIHTCHSFSPYTPTAAVYMACKSGLATAGIVDHDTTAGAREFLEAGRRIGMPVTVGAECRIDMSGTRLNGRRLNNPDQKSVAYVVMHGIPHSNIEKVDDFLKPYRAHRNVRNRGMIENINKLVGGFGVTVDFDRDVLPLSTTSVTERHLLFALTKKITEKYRTPADVVAFMKDVMGIAVSGKNEENILAGEQTPAFYEYDILGALKGNLVEKIYIPATAELPSVGDFTDMVHRYGGVAAYAYLGDVGNSVTGDKKAQKFEDDYLDEVFDVLEEYGFDAVTFMPTRNTAEQLDRVMELCRTRHFFQISGEDINSPRQKFICPAYENPKFTHLVEAAHTLIRYENLADTDLKAARELIRV
ncbi:MAG: PHP domain-containing protein [Ruminococcaceae bacterium]|nr:PHP domain-containing protein [Oscillospiraceae bacterium]